MSKLEELKAKEKELIEKREAAKKAVSEKYQRQLDMVRKKADREDAARKRKERKERTHRLIELGAIINAKYPDITPEQLKAKMEKNQQTKS